MKVSTLASLAGYSAARIRQLADAQNIPAMRVLKRNKYEVRWFQDGPALREWIADAQANKGKHWPKQTAKHSPKQHSSAPAPALPDDLALRALAEKCNAAHVKAVASAEDVLKDMRSRVEAAIKLGLYLEQEKAGRSRNDFNEWVHKHFPDMSVDTKERCLRLAQRAYDLPNWTKRQIFYQGCRLGRMTEKEARDVVR